LNRTRDEAITALIAAGEFDMIAIGRALISDPAWASLVRQRCAAGLRPFTRDLLARLE
jgi:2,4-dienoyl-CoA reductase-like NADH-dependent reductase (Old Yellow Enzyme family)